MHFCRKVEIVAINTEKITFFNDHTYKSDIGQHFHKSEKNPLGRHHHHRKSKQILKL